MSEKKFTPGPWKVEEQRSFHNWRFFPITAPMDPAGTISLRTEIATVGDGDTASLIAAAPDLLAAAEAAHKWIFDKGFRPQHEDSPIQQLFRAIEKAKGK